MKNLYRWIRAITFTLILMAVGIPTSLFILLSIPGIQNSIKKKAEKELSTLLDSKVEIRDLAIRPFNKLTLMDVSVSDRYGEKAIAIDRLGSAISLTDLIFTGDIVVNYVEIIGVDGKLYKETHETALNIQNIIDALKPKEKQEEKSFRLSVSSIILRNVNFSYNILSEPEPSKGRFNRDHITITNLRGDISVPLISNDRYEVNVHRLALDEQSGLSVTDLHGRFFLSKDSVKVYDMDVELPHSVLRFSPLSLTIADGMDMKNLLSKNYINFYFEDNSYITPSDLSCFYSPLSNFNSPLNVVLKLEGDAEKFILSPLRIVSPKKDDFTLDIEGKAFDILDSIGRRTDINKIYLRSNSKNLLSLLPENVSDKNRNIIGNIGKFTFDGELKLDEKIASTKGSLLTDIGDIDLSADANYILSKSSFLPLDYNLEVTGKDLELGEILPGKHLGNISYELTSKGKIMEGNKVSAEVELAVENLTYKNYTYHDINLTSNIAPGEIELSIVSSEDPNVLFDLNADYSYLARERKSLGLTLDTKGIDFSRLNLWDKYPDRFFSGVIEADLNWNTLDDICGFVSIDGVKVSDGSETKELIDNFTVKASGDYEDRLITANSELIDLVAKGKISIISLPDELKNLAHNILPSVIVPKRSLKSQKENIFDLSVTLRETAKLNNGISLPVYPLDRVQLKGSVNTLDGNVELLLSAPYIQQGNKLIENSLLHFLIEDGNKGIVNISSNYPTKHGPLRLNVDNILTADTIGTEINWKIDRQRDYSGNVELQTVFSKINGDMFNKDMLLVDVDIFDSKMVFNDSVWDIEPARINIVGQDIIRIDNLNVRGPGQEVEITGVISKNPEDILTVDLTNIDLEYIFESLSIDNVKLGGLATGNISASGLLSKSPNLITEGISVENISYNSCVIGDAIVLSNWDQDNKSVVLNADITQKNDLHSYVNGEIFPMNDSLDISFKCDQVDVAFLQPYMQAFTSEVKGRATGEARLWGNFKYIDLEGKVYADSVRMKIDFTDTWYYASDTVVINPGIINLDNLILHDDYGHQANVNGYVRHIFFKEPSFDFNITDADNLLVYDERESRNPKWYGRVFADGSARVRGYPGFVGISCDMTTAEGTTFTFVLSDMEEAGEYTFITYRDRDLLNVEETLVSNPTPPLVLEFLKRQQQQEEQGHSRYDIDFDIDITPEARMNLVMDPVGGDRIRAYGEGNMRMTYNSVDEELKMYGTYTLDRGDYNFTLQDIIIKDFTIRNGSSITFRGDPYSASLDITAVYSTNANLSDLDAMFLEDKEISRTNVPVHALLHISGDLHQPEISFDLEFPTLTQDTYRKVRSIVSTEDMMNRQIIYLLALNRFYTPEYMQSATRGNELISVASSTLSSQLSNILGQISDKFTISPNIRSERSDFSDMEVDLALSSTLLNNRLLLNGNFGYRDNLMNTNQFIGDFDIEYLLNRKGTLRLKAYNRYNDRNFYYKTATTTQGVGIVLKHDFDSFMSFLKMFQKKNNEKDKKNEE